MKITWFVTSPKNNTEIRTIAFWILFFEDSLSYRYTENITFIDQYGIYLVREMPSFLYIILCSKTKYLEKCV